MKPHYLKMALLAAILSLACTTKVSEWVLVNAPAERYQLLYYYGGTVSEAARRQNADLENRFRKANISFRSVQKSGITAPYYALAYKNRIMAEYKDYDAVKDIVTSPVRRKVATDLLMGKLCVMVYLKSGIREKDEPGIEAIRKSLASSPFGEIITLVELDRTQSGEKDFIDLLLQVESDLQGISEPMLFGVFGRFRVLEPLLAKGITEENVGLMISFLTADCSCVIKDELPGISMLHQADWENPLPAQVNKILDSNPSLIHH